jgi:hypothetical protein
LLLSCNAFGRVGDGLVGTCKAVQQQIRRQSRDETHSQRFSQIIHISSR